MREVDGGPDRWGRPVSGWARARGLRWASGRAERRLGPRGEERGDARSGPGRGSGAPSVELGVGLVTRTRGEAGHALLAAGPCGAMVSWAERARLVGDAREGGAGRAEADWAAGKEKGRVVLGLGYGSLFYFPFSFLFLLQTKFEFKSKFEFKPNSNN